MLAKALLSVSMLTAPGTPRSGVLLDVRPSGANGVIVWRADTEVHGERRSPIFDRKCADEGNRANVKQKTLARGGWVGQHVSPAPTGVAQ